MSTKRERALRQYKGFQGPATIAHIERNIESVWPTAWQELTGKQYGDLLNVANTSYHDGRHDAGAEVLDGDVVCIGKDVFLPLALLKQIKAKERYEHIYTPAQYNGLNCFETFYVKLPDGSYTNLVDKPTDNDVQLFTRRTYAVIDYYISDNLIYTERF